MLGAMFVALATALAGGLAQTSLTASMDPLAYAAVGAVACILCILVHHPSTSLAILATAVLVTLANAGGWANALTSAGSRSILFFNGAIFAAAYIVSRPCAYSGGLVLWLSVAFADVFPLTMVV